MLNLFYVCVLFYVYVHCVLCVHSYYILYELVLSVPNKRVCV